jgi:hypothetical protein
MLLYDNYYYYKCVSTKHVDVFFVVSVVAVAVIVVAVVVIVVVVAVVFCIDFPG